MLSEFQRVLIVRVIRPDKVMPFITKLVKTELGEKFVSPPPFDLNKSYSDSICLSPLIFILSPGVDPMASLLQFAEKMGREENLQSVSLGQGQVNGRVHSAAEHSIPSTYWILDFKSIQSCIPNNVENYFIPKK